MTRDEITKRIYEGLNATDREEIEFFQTSRKETIEDEIARFGETDCEEMDIIEAFIELCERADNLVSGEGFPGEIDRRAARMDQKRYDRILVSIGFYVPIAEEEARAAIRNGIGVKMKHFPKIDGQRYESAMTWQQLMETK